MQSDFTLIKKKKNPLVIMTTFEEANSVKPEKFTGSHFQRWKKQMKYWLIALGFISALEERNEKPSSSLAPGQIDYHYHNRILVHSLIIFMMYTTLSAMLKIFGTP